ncbi:MAG: MarR family transcriptional regulator [Bacteroidia bacterium]|nr:MarR family transcriptional regulator [Bacteroidia bacterium]
MAVQLSDNKLKLIEELGIYFEKSGIQPAASRVFALLMISDQNELTFEEIYETLNMSKSAGSNAINLLIGTDRVEYSTRPGERKRYFRVKVKSLKEGVQKSLNNLEVLKSLLQQVLTERTEETKVFNEGLKEVVGFLEFMRMELPVMFQKWENLKK